MFQKAKVKIKVQGNFSSQWQPTIDEENTLYCTSVTESKFAVGTYTYNMIH